MLLFPSTRPGNHDLRRILACCRHATGSLFALLALLAPASNLADTRIDLSSATTIQPGPDARVPSTSGNGIILPVAFTADVERLYWDLPVRPPDANAQALALDYRCEDLAAIRAISIHLRDGDNWLSTEVIPGNAPTGTLIFHRAEFSPENGSPRWHRASTLRLSFWKGAARSTAFTLRAIRIHRPTVAILRGSERTAPGETQLASRCATRALRLFEQAGIPAVILPDDIESLDMEPFRLVVLPYNPALTTRALTGLERYVKRHQGKLGVFYHADARLARLMGVTVLPYTTQSGTWTEVAFLTNRLSHLPPSMSHHTRHLLPVDATNRDSVLLGHWLTLDGFPDPSLPAAVQAPNGFWFSHIPPLAVPDAVQWLLATLAGLDPVYAPSRTTYLDTRKTRNRETRAMLDAVPARSNEVRAVWSSAIPPRQRNPLMQQLAANGINAVFEHVSTAGQLQDHTDADRPPPPDANDRALRHIQRAVAAARAHGLAYHAWVILWSTDSLPSDSQSQLKAANRLMLNARGEPIPWLCPSHPENRAALLGALAALARSGITGIHLDYVRYPAHDGCYAPATRAAFESSHGQPVERWPDDVLPGAPLADAYAGFRRIEMTSFVREAARIIREIAPSVRLSAAVYPTPDSAADNGQDWPAWLKEGLLDFVAPMLYSADAAQFTDRLAQTVVPAAPDPAMILPGIGTSADESQLDAYDTARQIIATRRNHTAGFILFQLDAGMTARLLPTLALP